MLTEPKLKQSLIVPWHFVVKCFFELTDIPIWTACKWMTFSVQHEIWILEKKNQKEIIIEKSMQNVKAFHL